MRKTTKKPTERIEIYNPNTVRETDIGNDTVGDFLLRGQNKKKSEMEMGNQITKFMFYELYWSLIKNESDQTAGRFIKRICQYMFTGNKLPTLKDKKEAFIWSNIEDFLIRSKEAEKNGKSLKTLNQQMRHFAFLETYYRAIDLMDDEQSGAYTKALCKYMFEGIETTDLYRLRTHILHLRNSDYRYQKSEVTPPKQAEKRKRNLPETTFRQLGRAI